MNTVITHIAQSPSPRIQDPVLFGLGYADGTEDALYESDTVLEVRASWARDHAAPAWADGYAAGITAGRDLLARLDTHIAAIRTRPALEDAA